MNNAIYNRFQKPCPMTQKDIYLFSLWDGYFLDAGSELSTFKKIIFNINVLIVHFCIFKTFTSANFHIGENRKIRVLYFD